MAKIGRILQGRKTKADGEAFENWFKTMAQLQRWHCLKIPDGSKTVRTREGLKVVRAKAPFDFILAKNKVSLFVDAKICSENRFNHARLTVHQITELKKFEDEGFFAGYVVYFKKLHQIVFFSATQLTRLMAHSSLTPEQGISLGTTSGINVNLICAARQEEPTPSPEPQG